MIMKTIFMYRIIIWSINKAERVASLKICLLHGESGIARQKQFIFQFARCFVRRSLFIFSFMGVSLLGRSSAM